MTDDAQSDDNEVKKNPTALGSIAEESVKAAINRGRKRRARTQGSRGSRNLHNDSEIHIVPSQANPSSLVNPANQIPYHKRRRTALIPTAADDSEDSNDEWEEHVEVDRDLAVAREHENQGQSPDKSNDDEGSSDEIQKDNKSSSGKQLKKDDKHNNPVPDEKTKARMKRRLLARARKKLVQIHSIQASALISLLLRHDSVAQLNEEVRALALSTAPVELFNAEIPFKERVSTFALWTRTAFRPTACIVLFDGARQPTPLVRHCCAAERAVRVVSTDHGAGDIFDVATVAAATARSCQLRCRIVSALQLIPHKLKPQAGQRSPLSADPSSTKHNQPMILDSNTTSVMYSWLEVWCEDKWRAIDLLDGSVCMGEASETVRKSAERIAEHKSGPIEGEKKEEERTEQKEDITAKPAGLRRSSRSRTRRSVAEEKEKEREREREAMKSVDEMRRRRTLPPNFFAHVVAVEDGMVRDVSRRYSTAWSEIEKMRATGKVFSKLVGSMGRRSAELEDEIKSERLEQEEFEARAALESVPTTLTAVQKHPRYVLERHVKKYEVVHPKEPVMGHINNEPVYLRANVHLLHTRDRWIRQMREVIKGENPLKAVPSKNGTDSTVDLFGEWQTNPLYISPIGEDGTVPRGKHGNVDLWTDDHMPAGGAHVNLKYAKQAAKRLGINFAPAMTGFELRRRRSVPRIEGVVVAQTFEEAVREAALELEAAAIKRAEEKARAEEKRLQEIERRTREAEETLRRKYGGVGGEDESGDVEKSGFKSTTSKKSKSVKMVGTAHVHEYGKDVHVKGDKWKKKCKGCGIEVTFEKI